MVIQELRLGPRELKLLFTLEKEGTEVFLYQDARRILAGTEDSTKGVLKRLRKKGRIQEIEKGKYLLVPSRAGIEGSWTQVPHLLVPRIAPDGYVAYWSALSHWGLTEQTPRTVFVATPRQKRPIEFGPTKFQFVHTSPKKHFGTTQTKIAGGTFKISDLEKTLIDCLEFTQYAGGMSETAKALWEASDELEYAKLLLYAKRQGVGAVVRRLGHLLETFSLADDTQNQIQTERFKGFLWFDPHGPRKRLGYCKEHGLILNRSEDEILSWRQT